MCIRNSEVQKLYGVKDYYESLMPPNGELSLLYTGAHFQLWRTIIHVRSQYAPRKYDKRLSTPAIV